MLASPRGWEPGWDGGGAASPDERGDGQSYLPIASFQGRGADQWEDGGAGRGRGGRRWRGREWGRGAEVPLGGGGEAAPLRGAERTAAGPGARPRGCSARRWPRPPGPGRRLRPWTAGAACGRCWRRRSGCVSAAGAGGARGRGTAAALAPAGIGPCALAPRRGPGAACELGAGIQPAGSAAAEARDVRRLSVLLPRVPACWGGEEPTCWVPGRAAAALLRAPAEPPARGPGRPGPPGIRVRSPGSARCTSGEWPAFRWGLCCRFLFAFSETVCFVFRFPPLPARFGASPMGEPTGSCLISPRSRRGAGRKCPGGRGEDAETWAWKKLWSDPQSCQTWAPWFDKT